MPVCVKRDFRSSRATVESRAPYSYEFPHQAVELNTGIWNEGICFAKMHGSSVEFEGRPPLFKSLIAFSTLCAAVGVWITLASKESMAGRELRLGAIGRSTIAFNASHLKENGLQVDLGNAKACFKGSNPAFRFANSDLRFRSAAGRFLAFEEGAISHYGGFKLVAGKKTVDVNGFTIAKEPKSGRLALKAKSSKGPIVAFELSRPRDLRKSEKGQVILDSMNVRVSKECAEELGKPEIAGEEIGTLTLFAESEVVDGGGEVEIPAEAAPSFAPQDVSISNMSTFQVATSPTGIVGSTPNRTYGFTMLTTSCNLGTENIPWQSPMQTAHPVIAMNLYRVLNGRFEHVGWSWLKHGFFATNESTCGQGGTCPGGGGSILKPFCTDTYGPGNNADRTYLGGRDEVNPFTGVWTCQNSWFSNFQNDCIRRNPGIDPIDAVAHRLVVAESDLGNAGATYYYEAYYITPNDANTYNNVASRQTTLGWNGTTLTISNSGTAQVQGPAINRWGDLRTTATPQTDGDVIVAVQVTNNGNGTWHYEYAVYNHNLDRQIREFVVPLPASATVTNIETRDIDKNAGNQWTSSFSNGLLKWSSPTFGSPGTNPLKYSSVFNFRFDANLPPASTTATLGLFKPGTGTELTAATRGPLVLSPVSSMQIVNGVQTGGNQQSLDLSDDNRLGVSPTDAGQRFGTGVSVSAFAPAGTINSLVVGVESSNTSTPGNGSQTIELWNWNTSSWEPVDTRTATQADSAAYITISSNASRFVNATTREVRARILHISLLGFSSNRWRMAFDQIGFHYN